MSYLDFEVEIGFRNKENTYPVAVLHSPAGEARAKMSLSSNEWTLEGLLKKLQMALHSGAQNPKELKAQEQYVREFGKMLFQRLFTEEVGHLYYQSLHGARNQKKGLRIRLRILPPELAGVPWEYLYDSREDYLGLSLHTPVVRYLELPRSPDKPLAITPPLRILGMVASPIDLPGLEVEQEKKQLEKALSSLQVRGMVELTWLDGQNWGALHTAIRGGNWHMFHFIGHGGFDPQQGEGFIALANEKGNAEPFHATKLGRLLNDCDSLRFALLNACEGARGSKKELFSSIAATLVRRGIPAVLAMQYEISDQAAIELARTFYESLADGLPVDSAVAQARQAISFGVSKSFEWGTPVLYMRSQDGQLFDIRHLNTEPDPPPGMTTRPLISLKKKPINPAPPTRPLTLLKRPIGQVPQQVSQIDQLFSQLLEAESKSNHQGVIELAKRILEQQPDHQAAPLKMSSAYKTRGQKYHQQGNCEQAIADYTCAIEIKPEEADLYYQRAQSYKRQNNPAAARQDIEQAAKLGHLAARKELSAVEPFQSGVLAYHEHRIDEAIVAMKRVILLDRTHLDAHNELGTLFHFKGQLNHATDVLEHTLTLEANNPDSHLRLALVYNSNGQSDKAIQSLKRYLELAPPEKEAQITFARNLLQEIRAE
ncbi:MAG: CHAT domain-containing protein [Ardenticatenaceae bacterium]